MMQAAKKSVPAGPATTKGICFVNIRHFVKDKFGDEMWERVLAALNEADRDIAITVGALAWYDVTVFGRLLRTVDKVCGKGDLSLIKEIGRYEAEHDFNRTVRLFLRAVDPVSLIKMGQRLWSHFQSSGEIDIEEVPGGINAVVNGWVTDEAQCVELLAYVQRTIEFSGGKNVILVHQQCRGRGDARCFTEVRWK
jgi:hypothetical protein